MRAGGIAHHTPDRRPAAAGGRTLRSGLRIGGALVAALLTGACQSSTVSGLHVRARPTTQSPVLTSLGPSGTSVTITCFTRGEAVHGDTVWYRISRPRAGYVSNYYIHTDSDDLSTIGAC